MKKILAIVLAAMLLLMTVGAVAETANPVAGKKVSYVHILPSATIFQMWSDSSRKLCDALGVDDVDWEQVVAETVPQKVRELNLQAFRAGRAAAEK